MKDYFVYIVTNTKNGVLYTGVTSNLEKRIYEHKNKIFEGFSNKYNCNKLIYIEQYQDINIAIQREKEIKKWGREKKINLIEKTNKHWFDLSEKWYFKN